MTVGVVVKAFTSYFLLGTKGIAEYGAPIGSLACNLTVVLLNFAFMLKCATSTQDALSVSRCFAKPFVSSVLSIGSSYVAYTWLSQGGISEFFAFLIAVFVAILLYCLFVFLFGALDKDDMRTMPILKNFIKEK